MNECRICLEYDEDLISPCWCNGTIQYVHLDCLEQWFTNHSLKKCCDICEYEYHNDYDFPYKYTKCDIHNYLMAFNMIFNFIVPISHPVLTMISMNKIVLVIILFLMKKIYRDEIIKKICDRNGIIMTFFIIMIDVIISLTLKKDYILAIILMSYAVVMLWCALIYTIIDIKSKKIKLAFNESN